MNFLNLSYAAAALAFIALVFLILLKRREAKMHPPTIVQPWRGGDWKPRELRKLGEQIAAPPARHVHMLRVGRSSVEQLTEGVQMRCCMSGCEEPFYMDGETVAWVRDWLNATRADSVKVQAIR